MNILFLQIPKYYIWIANINVLLGVNSLNELNFILPVLYGGEEGEM
jgi:hypothetical protein